MTNGWDITAAIATTASAVFVAWQAGETRRATRISQNALKASQTVTLDAARGRLDGQAPQVEVHQEEPAWPALANSGYGWPQPWPATQEWHFPRDEDVLLSLRVTAVVTNHSSRPVHATFQGDLWQPRPDDGEVASLPPQRMQRRLLLAPGETVRTELRKHFPLKDWAENHRIFTEQTGETPPATARGTVRVHDDRDNGVIDQWDLVLGGFPIQPYPDRLGVWHLTLPTLDQPAERCVDYALQPPRTRTYWLSRSKNIQLPDPEYPTAR